jgi:site-specific recombinase XerD
MPSITVQDSMNAYVQAVHLARSENTARTYRNALQAFADCLRSLHLDPDHLPASRASEAWIGEFTTYLKGYAPTSEQLYMVAVTGWYEYLVAEGLAGINLARLRLLVRHRARRPGQRLPQFPRTAIERVLAFAETLGHSRPREERDLLRARRDAAFLFTLADTGLRVHEACGMRRGDLDWDEARALLIGKGNRQAVVRFSSRSLRHLQAYLHARARLDGQSARPLASLPVFARHDRRAGERILPITTSTGRAIVHQRVAEALGADDDGTITPHSFRHYFVTTVLRASGGNLKLAQELARHRNISVTQRYAHLSNDELDRGYHAIFNTGDPADDTPDD